MRKYVRFAVAATAPLGVFAIALISEGRIAATEWVAVVIATVGAFGALMISNTPE